MLKAEAQPRDHETEIGRRRASWIPIIVIVLLFALVPVVSILTEQTFILRVATRIILFSIAAVGLNLIMGFGGLVSLMHAAFVGIGAYVIGIAAFHADSGLAIGPWIISGTTNLVYSVPLSLVISSAVAGVLGLVALRTSGVYFIMITLAFNQMIFYFLVALQQYGGEEGLQINKPLNIAGIATHDRLFLYALCLASLCLVLIASAKLTRSRFGAVLRAASDNEVRVAAVGIPILRYRLTAFVISAAIASLSGILLAITQQYVSPAEAHWIRSADLLVIAVLGGMTTVWGPVVGAVVFLLLELVFSALTIHWKLLFGTLIVVFAMLLRGGLSDLFVGLRRQPSG